MMASSWLIMTAAISFSYASPLDHMHHLRYVLLCCIQCVLLSAVVRGLSWVALKDCLACVLCCVDLQDLEALGHLLLLIRTE